MQMIGKDSSILAGLPAGVVICIVLPSVCPSANKYEYLRKIKSDPSFMADCRGIFTSRSDHPKRFERYNNDMPQKEKNLNVKYTQAASYFTYLWRDQPEILNTTTASELIGANRQYIRRKYESNEMKGIIIRGLLMLTKREFHPFLFSGEVHFWLFVADLIFEDIISYFYSAVNAVFCLS